eukprot:2894812-Rhodomonas_salina.1
MQTPSPEGPGQRTGTGPPAGTPRSSSSSLATTGTPGPGHSASTVQRAQSHWQAADCDRDTHWQAQAAGPGHASSSSSRPNGSPPGRDRAFAGVPVAAAHGPPAGGH